jgi:transcription elongation factor Elf1
MYQVEFICPDCGHYQQATTQLPPKAYTQLLPDELHCEHCKRKYPRAWLIGEHLLQISASTEGA